MAEGSAAEASQQPAQVPQNPQAQPEEQQVMELDWAEIPNAQLEQMTRGELATKHEQLVGFISDTTSKIEQWDSFLKEKEQTLIQMEAYVVNI